MARKSVSLQLSELREYTTKLEIELAGYKEIIKTSMELANRSRSAPKAKTFVSLKDKAIAFFQAHPGRTKPATVDEIKNWNPGN